MIHFIILACCAAWFEQFLTHVVLRLPDVLQRQGLSLNLLSKLVLPLIHEKYFVDLEQLWNC